MTKLLLKSFLDKYPDKPEHMNTVSNSHYTLLAKWDAKESRFETWKEHVERIVERNLATTFTLFAQNKMAPPVDKIRLEAEALFDNIFNLRQFLSLREHLPNAHRDTIHAPNTGRVYNSALIEITSWSGLVDVFSLLLAGADVSYKCSRDALLQMKPVRNDYTLKHATYKPVPREFASTETAVHFPYSGNLTIVVGNSRKGWLDAFQTFLDILTEDKYDHVYNITINYNNVQNDSEFFEKDHINFFFLLIDKIIKDENDAELDPFIRKVDTPRQPVMPRPVHIYDMVNAMTHINKHDTMSLYITTPDELELLSAREQKLTQVDRTGKIGVTFKQKPSKRVLHILFEFLLDDEGIMLINEDALRKARPNGEGISPNGALLLDVNGAAQSTNINVAAFVIEEEGSAPRLDYGGLMQAQALSTRASLRNACIMPHESEFRFTSQRDRLVGASITGWHDAVKSLNYDADQQGNLLNLLAENAHIESLKYSGFLRVPTPLLNTTVDNDALIASLAGGVSEGVRVENAGALEQLAHYLLVQEHYSSHNTAVTLQIPDEEREQVVETLEKFWDELIAVTIQY